MEGLCSQRCLLRSIISCTLIRFPETSHRLLSHHPVSQPLHRASEINRTPVVVIMTKRAATKKFKKAPGAPRRFTSAYMYFSSEKHKELRSEFENRGETVRALDRF